MSRIIGKDARLNGEDKVLHRQRKRYSVSSQRHARRELHLSQDGAETGQSKNIIALYIQVQYTG